MTLEGQVWLGQVDSGCQWQVSQVCQFPLKVQGLMKSRLGSGTQISSYYTWSPNPVVPTADDSDIYDVPFSFVPMLWGCTSQSETDAFLEQLAGNFSNVTLTPSRDILGFNEPDHAGQAECTPSQAAQVWVDVLEPLKEKGYRLGSPAVTGGDTGKQWMIDWYSACNGGCNPDFTAVHWYDPVAQDFIEHIQHYHNEYDLPIWVTEYAPQNFSVYNSTTGLYDDQATYIEIQRFMDVTTAYMKSVSWVERWFWFGAMYDMQDVNTLDTLFDESGKESRTGALNDLGVEFAGANGSVVSSYDHSGSDGTLAIEWNRVLVLWVAVNTGLSCLL
ncbi:hypothetical protein L198_08022 [Cryptococcus wingfieldii CBS 7118]|uniref:Asl1-like glycosyl hydrolase catalytic domain-containing protein n=1 Tax=Cryptococcus wingfieldii CBS 7118 TaxID=1295528 RepID=A0A1E3HP15_9TREE|nr:hypothetical protein L198_07990 [Cryptococcus wingfieldii CBS 7118]XP_019028056.1 hypothetical protein L198_08022 [Cryptococcus wingfieldii CBS 7118]ODN78071.1 hypothetical protein L198_07990 [Cryptococcus wingfieldii CBS 7118]ODN78103.1 hypothetical protein L198_08022 [Cryptococcus wingfieldii CBS 7118]